MRIITISGLDGSGKSTQIEMLKNYLESQSKKVFYFHAIQFGIANKIFCHSEQSEESRPIKKGVIKAGKFKIFLRKVALRIDMARFKKLIAKLEKEGYDYLISDRYFYDSVVNIEYLNLNLKLGFRKFLKLGFRKADLAIYLQASPEIIMQRERKPDQGLEYLQKKKEIYDKYAAFGPPAGGLKIINGNRNKEEIFEEIRTYVK